MILLVEISIMKQKTGPILILTKIKIQQKRMKYPKNMKEQLLIGEKMAIQYMLKKR